MRAIYIVIICFMIRPGHSQIIQLNSGTSTALLDLSINNNNIMVCGRNNYLVKSYDACDHLYPLNSPAPANYLNRLVRVDTNNLYLLSFTPSQTLVYRSVDGGSNWTEKLNGSGDFNRQLAFFDSLEGIMSGYLSIMYRTTNGGNTWSTTPSPITGLNSIDVIRTFSDSIICIGALVAPNATGEIFLSKDRGHTWPYHWGMWSSPIDFFFLNTDTIFGVSYPDLYGAEFTRSTNGGVNWQNLDIPLNTPSKIYFKNAKEGYVVGANTQTIGVILKTNDLGQTWSSFNTGINTQLLSIEFLNDSIAILSGSNGVLLRWNSKQTVFTGIQDHASDDLSVSLFPNPVKDKLVLQFEDALRIEKLSITNALGQEILTIDNLVNKKEIDVSLLPAGLYYLKAGNKKQQKVFKVLKE